MEGFYRYTRQELIDMIGFVLGPGDKVRIEYDPLDDAFWFIVENLDAP